MHRRGIALITTLMMTGLLLLLLGAFMQLQRSQFSVLGSGQDREDALRTVISVHEYCVNRIERDKSWGTVNFTEFEDPELAGYMKVKELENSRNLEGSIPSLDSTFEARVENSLEATPSRVVFTITAQVGTLSRTVTSTLRPAPLYDSAIAAGGAMRVEATRWTVGSKDPYRNLVRAKGEIAAPDYTLVDFVGKDNSASERGSDEGIFWARNDITFSSQSVTDPTVLQEVVDATGGMFFPNSGVNHSIHELQASDVITPANSTSIQDGEYRFTTATATYDNWEVVGHDSFGNPEYGWVPRSRIIPIMGRYMGGGVGALTDYWFTKTSLPSLIQNLDLGLPGLDHPQIDQTFTLDTGAQVEVTLDMPDTQPSFRILADGQVQIPGTFKVTSTGDDPILSFSGAGGDSQIEAEGDVEFEGELSGSGIVISKTGSVTLDITSADTTGNHLGVSVFANTDILINSTGTGDLNFSGLVYAKENVTVNGGDQDFTVDGALVARNGNININTGGEVDLTYNPEHLETLLEKLPENRTKLETLTWRE
ncbi:MAG: hypothetical protein WC423_02260 [Vulcanimicrobiota bacterium]